MIERKQLLDHLLVLLCKSIIWICFWLYTQAVLHSVSAVALAFQIRTHYTSMNELLYFMNTSVCSHLGHRTQFNLDFNMFQSLNWTHMQVCARVREHMRQKNTLSVFHIKILPFYHSLIHTFPSINFHFFYSFKMKRRIECSEFMRRCQAIKR